jgi:ribosomal protein S18 acetylase RimI-like enzyme
MDVGIVQLGLGDIDRVEPLWEAMRRHHVALSSSPARDPAESWPMRREQYRGWLEGSEPAWLLGAESGGELLGYAMVVVRPGQSPTFDSGPFVGDLESLSVAEHARGAGVGRALIARARDLLREQGVQTWLVGVVADNDGAQRLYEREGFRVAWVNLIAPVDAAEELRNQ